MLRQNFRTCCSLPDKGWKKEVNRDRKKIDGNGEFYVKFFSVNFLLLIAPSKHVRHEQRTFSPARQLLFVESNSASKVAARERHNF
jgi:hypothetical protein